MQFLEHTHIDKNEKSYYLFLTEDETDQHFDPFDPTDSELPSHLHHAGHRFIRDETYEWLIANVGEPQINWGSSRTNNQSRFFWFNDKSHAMKFKLVFG